MKFYLQWGIQNDTPTLDLKECTSIMPTRVGFRVRVSTRISVFNKD